MAQVFIKDPNAVLDYSFNWAPWLASGETISASTMAVQTGLTKDSDTSTTTSATVWLSGGTAGTSYTVANRITTTDLRTDERTIIIQVEQR
jgi:hypothetical protein